MPVPDLRQIFTILADVDVVLRELALDDTGEFFPRRGERRDTLDHRLGKMKPIQSIEHGDVERRRGRPFLLIAMGMDGVVSAALGQPVNERRIAVIGEDHRRGPSRSFRHAEGREVLEETKTIAGALEQRLGSADPRSFKTELDRLGLKDTAALDRINDAARLVDWTHRAELRGTYELTRSLKKGLGLSI